jgi:arylsulfatase A-like enzyme
MFSHTALRSFVPQVLACAALSAASAVLAAQGNVLMLLADDVGVDKIGAYAEGGQIPATPNINALAAGGVRFKTCWANATSSTTRATILTGRYGFRTGIGYLVLQDTSTPALSISEMILPELFDLGLPGLYHHAAIGKWHLGNFTVGGDFAPNFAGFEYCSGILTNMEGTDNYSQWKKTVNGSTSYSNQYITTDQVDEAIGFINSQTGPWYCQVWFWASHAPYEAPPTSLCGCVLPPPVPHGVVMPYYDATLVSMDAEIGRLLSMIPSNVLANTTILFSADNGTPAESTVAPFNPAHAKPTLYEGGLRVPLIIKGPQVVQPGRVVNHLVNTVDFYSTVLDLVGVQPQPLLPPGTKIDSVSMLPYLTDPNAPAQRKWIFSDLFYAPLFEPKRTIRDTRFKYLRQGTFEELYDLQLDPWETNNLMLGTLTPFQTRMYRNLKLQMETLLAS